MKRRELKEKKQNRKNKGITLIALVVTIVVLLILAGVSISMLGGENGIITQAIEAKDENEKAEEKEKVQLAVTAAKGKTNWGEITEENLAEELTKNIGERDTDYTLTKNGDTFTVTYTDSNRSYEVDANGNVTGPTNSEENPSGGGAGSLTPGERYDEDTDLTIGDDKITIPGGSTISKIPGEYEDIDEGIVIYIIPEGETPDWTAKDENGVYEVQKKYDQFVWVPVEKAYVTTEEIGGNSYTNLKNYVSTNGIYPMAIEISEGTYKGILYDFADGTDAVIPTPMDYTTTSSYREPDVVTGSDGTSWDASTTYLNQINGILNTSYSDSTSFKTDLETDFNAMVTRVASKGGFWVGRYETSQMSDSTTETYTESNEIQVGVKRGSTTGIASVNWYRMYAQQKLYKSLALTESASVTSSMIWGSQWDQIMIWMKSIPSKYTDSTYTGKFYVTNAVSMGNFGTISGVDDGWSSTSSPAPTGNSENYKVKNVFDLAGNVFDWTLEAYDTYLRVFRGGCYDFTGSSYTRADLRYLNFPHFSFSNGGTRATLY